MSTPSAPSPMLFMDALGAYQRTAVIRAAIELGVFTAIGADPAGVPAIAERCQASERGIRALCDVLTSMGFLIKEAGLYQQTPDTAMFLDRRSPAYLGGVTQFMLNPSVLEGFATLTDAVRKGGTAMSPLGSLAPEHPMWVDFARAMGPMMLHGATALPALLPFDADRPLKVLDIAAGHGLYGIQVARRYPKAEITALDWPNVLQVAQENAQAAGIGDRYKVIAGSAFDVDLGAGYDVVLLTGFLHHFDPPTCETLLRKIRASLAEGGLVATVEIVPDPDRVSPAQASAFSVVMLATTPSGDAYTFAELEGMAKRAGFSRTEEHMLAPPANKVLLSYT